jgi:hypothetical protein
MGRGGKMEQEEIDLLKEDLATAKEALSDALDRIEELNKALFEIGEIAGKV